ncbi:MAG: prolyl oligopeptidase family serine peptidase [Sphingorhabdus sp.]|jgi:dipeptidyl aminopeptidase/acylaminoacyl peptidase|uniref:S9 family peptidase n=1 Tax=Sphingorhabdus sp. TaxID=1902408 RepID=UPI00273F0539|nr:prolyl oligopeptidase family serine peptidase [Sphingorhabdus sp.]MDP4873209.1 prolyl oligopeptidase family serine peptidase [Sphingorhabdus sp.]MDP4927312.1 prolyl oligopeptidase family serine peptidase [Sphingorhabdus sp.]
MKKLLLIAALALPMTPLFADAPKPEALLADGLPSIPDELPVQTRPYMEFRTASFAGWHPTDKSMLVATRFANTTQIHRVAGPMLARKQISFEAEPVSNGQWAPQTGDVLIVQKDVGGGEFFQLYALRDGKLDLLTDGKSRNAFNAWSQDGELVAYSSTRRNGTDSDLYVMNPRDPSTNKMVAQVQGGGWAISDFAPDKKTAIVSQYRSVTNVDMSSLDLASGQMTPIGDHQKDVAIGGAEFAPDGTLWVTSDEGADFQRLGTMDIKTGAFTPRGPTEKWDVEAFDISPDGSFIVYATNEAGVSKVKILDIKTGGARVVQGLPAGIVGSFNIAEWGDIGITFTSARSAADAYSIDPKYLKVTRWTESETGGLDVTKNVEPELMTIKSFDGLQVSGFLYRPDPVKFPGKRPMLMNVHGGPEGQSRPGFQGRSNYLLNEMGVAIFYPNVRGSTGYGKNFVGLDNGPFKRENSVKDMGAFLSALGKDASLDASRFGLAGGSYGGYMCYAAAVQFRDKLRATNCVVAISNFVTFLENTQSYRRDLRRVEYGDERDPAQRAKLLEISPLTRVAEITKPMFVVTGGNDPRVPASEADQIVKAIRDKGGVAWHLLGKNEGHGFAKKENVDYQFWASLMFWKQNLLN